MLRKVEQRERLSASARPPRSPAMWLLVQLLLSQEVQRQSVISLPNRYFPNKVLFPLCDRVWCAITKEQTCLPFSYTVNHVTLLFVLVTFLWLWRNAMTKATFRMNCLCLEFQSPWWQNEGVSRNGGSHLRLWAWNKEHTRNAWGFENSKLPPWNIWIK